MHVEYFNASMLMLVMTHSGFFYGESTPTLTWDTAIDGRSKKIQTYARPSGRAEGVIFH